MVKTAVGPELRDPEAVALWYAVVAQYGHR